MILIAYLIVSFSLIAMLYVLVEKYKNNRFINFLLLIICGLVLGMYLTAIEIKHYFFGIIGLSKYQEYNFLIESSSIICFFLMIYIGYRLVWTRKK